MAQLRKPFPPINPIDGGRLELAISETTGSDWQIYVTSDEPFSVFYQDVPRDENPSTFFNGLRDNNPSLKFVMVSDGVWPPTNTEVDKIEHDTVSGGHWMIYLKYEANQTVEVTTENADQFGLSGVVNELLQGGPVLYNLSMYPRLAGSLVSGTRHSWTVKVKPYGANSYCFPARRSTFITRAPLTRSC